MSGLTAKRHLTGELEPPSQIYPYAGPRGYRPMLYDPFENPERGSIRGLHFPLEISLGLGLGYLQIKKKKKKKTHLTGFLQRINIIALCSQRSIWLVYSIANQNPSFFPKQCIKHEFQTFYLFKNLSRIWSHITENSIFNSISKISLIYFLAHDLVLLLMF